MRSHPVVGSLFLLIGAGFFVAGAIGRWSPKHMPGPLPATVLIPFVLWQLGVWAALFGFFFLRARGRPSGRRPRFAL